MSRKGENIYKRKDGRWEGRYIKYYDLNSKPKFGYVYGKTYSEVKVICNELKVKYMQPEVSKETIPFNTIINNWLAQKRITVKESTYSRYKNIVDNHITTRLGEIPIESISNETIEEYIVYLHTNGRTDNNGGLSSKSISDILSIINNIFKYAKAKNISLQYSYNSFFKSNNTKDVRVLSNEECKALTKTLLDNTDCCKLGVLICLYTGMRIGEICALKWQNIDLTNKIIKVRETMQRIQNIDNNCKKKTKIIFTTPKSVNSSRDIPIPDCIFHILSTFKSQNDCFLLTNSKCNYIEPRTLQNRFKKYISNSKIENVNFHILRHTFATRCIELGFELKCLSEILGHSNVNITLNKYIHSSLITKKKNMDLLFLDA